jgi:hypothetical protein
MVQLMDKGSPAIILRGQCSYNQSIQIQTNIAIRQYKLAIARKHHLCLRCYATPPWLTKHQARERKFSALWEASSRPVMGPRWVSFYSAYACSLLTKQINIEHSHAYTLPESSFFFSSSVVPARSNSWVIPGVRSTALNASIPTHDVTVPRK